MFCWWEPLDPSLWLGSVWCWRWHLPLTRWGCPDHAPFGWEAPTTIVKQLLTGWWTDYKQVRSVLQCFHLKSIINSFSRSAYNKSSIFTSRKSTWATNQIKIVIVWPYLVAEDESDVWRSREDPRGFWWCGSRLEDEEWPFPKDTLPSWKKE